MSRSQESFSKKEREKQRKKKKKDKAEKKAQKKSDDQSNSLDDMIAYVDENGHIVDKQPDITKKSKIKAEDIDLDYARPETDNEPLTGIIEFYNDEKGYGFINSINSHDKYFFHSSGLLQPIKERNKVTFELQDSPRGKQAIKIKII